MESTMADYVQRTVRGYDTQPLRTTKDTVKNGEYVYIKYSS
jgi:hypothetical protein